MKRDEQTLLATLTLINIFKYFTFAYENTIKET